MALVGGGVSAEYQLYCNWQGRAWLHDDVHCWFIDNAVGWVDWVGAADGDAAAAASRLTVQIAFGRPTFENEIGSLTVDFAVTETDDSGAIQRDVRRPFQIWADGRRTALF
jgi:hypothetical protein